MLDDTKTSALEAASRVIAAAQAVEADCRPTLAAAERDVAHLDERLRDLEAQRSAIADRRAAGQASDRDAGDLLLIVMDAENLVEMRARAANEAAKARDELAAASSHTASAQAEFTRVQHRIEHAVLQDRLAQLLVLAIAAHAATSAALARVDPRDMAQSRRNLPDIASGVEALFVGVAKELCADQNRMGGRLLWRPSQDLQMLLQFLELNGPIRQGGY